MTRHLLTLARDSRGAVAPTVALSLFALIGAGGIAFDYARLASLDTELQQAADQAALAAATQLDQQAGAVARATAAAQGLLANNTLFANDGNVANRAVTIPSVLFYATTADAEAANVTDPTACPTAGAIDPATTTADATARFVCVRTGTRIARYAMTPVVGALASGNVSAMAVAGLGAAICKTPPVMICNPQETGTNLDFDAVALRGAGMRLVSVGGGTGGWAPGNFGYLDSNGGSNGAPGLREALGWSTPPGDCIAQSGVDTKPGATVTVTDALNTRFDIYTNVACPAGGTCGASINSVKDVIRPLNASGGNACRLHNAGWHEPTNRYAPTSASADLAASITPTSMGHPPDKCHAVADSTTGYCTGPIGDGNWDRNAYFRTHYVRASDGSRWDEDAWRAALGFPTGNPTRYQVYTWEYVNRGRVFDDVTVLDPTPPSATGSDDVAYGLPQCSASEGYAPIVPEATVPDRRRISVAVVNCVAQSVNGAETNLPVIKWIDVFLVRPSLNRGSTATANYSHDGTVYAEVIGETQTGASQTAGQVVRRDLPYLVK